MANILIVDDDVEICETLSSLVMRQGHNCKAVQSIGKTREIIREQPFDVLFLDVKLPDGNGLDMLEELVLLEQAPEVIILTGKGDPDGAELAIKKGVWDYILKPSSVKEISLTLKRAILYRQEKQGHEERTDLSSENIVGDSSEIQAACRIALQAAESDANMLITGETGTGKEVFARTIHEQSLRKTGSFVVVDCASLTESLVESILFGHKKGAYTGASESQDGLVKHADKGTLFLDEVGEMPLSIQKTLLRVLQERTFRAVGDSKEQHSDFRLIAATNRDLDEMVERGDFRHDLLFRIKTYLLHLPPLRFREGDVKLLVEYKLKQLSTHLGMGEKNISHDFYDVLKGYHWPGNVRELFNMIERAYIAAGASTQLFAMHLPRSLRIQVAKEQIKKLSLEDDQETDLNNEVRKIGQDIFHDIFDRPLPSLKDFKGTAEKVYLTELIRQHSSDVVEILRVSGLSRSHFYSLLKKHNLVVRSEKV